MNLFSQIWEKALALFDRTTQDKRALRKSQEHKDEYERVDRVNFTAIFATALANKAISDSTMMVKDSGGKDSRRSEWLETGLRSVWAKKREVISQALGKGGKVLVPYVVNGKAYVDIIDQSRMNITSMHGDEITGATLMADIGSKNGKVYYRFADYRLEGNVHTIVNRATNDNGGEVGLDILPEWESIEPVITINGAEHILFGYLKCPQDSREDKQTMGVPITYGSEHIVQELHTCLADISREFSLKKSFVGADDRLFDKDSRLPEGGLFRKFRGTGLKNDSFWEVFDPAIRDSAYLARFQQLCGLLESSVGVSPGILTEPRTAGATATEIKAANAATFAMVDAIRKKVEAAFAQLAYALDVLAEAYGATPAGAMGDWQITWDWDMSMTESSTETFNQYSELESRSLITPERLVSWATGMSLEEAKAEVTEAQARKPQTVDALLTEE